MTIRSRHVEQVVSIRVSGEDIEPGGGADYHQNDQREKDSKYAVHDRRIIVKCGWRNPSDLAVNISHAIDNTLKRSPCEDPDKPPFEDKGSQRPR